ncbi:hypothetical protein D3C73_1620550 [compost metagenome]
MENEQLKDKNLVMLNENILDSMIHSPYLKIKGVYSLVLSQEKVHTKTFETTPNEL